MVVTHARKQNHLRNTGYACRPAPKSIGIAVVEVRPGGGSEGERYLEDNKPRSEISGVLYQKQSFLL